MLKNKKTFLTITVLCVTLMTVGIVIYQFVFDKNYQVLPPTQIQEVNTNDATINSEPDVSEVEPDSSQWSLPERNEEVSSDSYIHGVKNFPGLVFSETENRESQMFGVDSSFVERVVIKKTNGSDNVFDSLTAGDVIESYKAEIDVKDSSIRYKNYKSDKFNGVLEYYKTNLGSKGYTYTGNQRSYPLQQTFLKQSSDHYFVSSDKITAFVLRHTVMTTYTDALDTSDPQTHFVDKEIFEIAYLENLGLKWTKKEFVSPSKRYIASIVNGDAYEVQCGYLNYNCFFEIVDALSNKRVFIAKLYEFPAFNSKGELSKYTVRVNDVLWTENDELFLVGGTGDGGYWTKGYYQFDLSKNHAVGVFFANGGECPSNSYTIGSNSYWVHDAKTDYDECLTNPEQASGSGFEVYKIDSDSKKQTFVKIVPDEETFLEEFATDLPTVVFNHYKN